MLKCPARDAQPSPSQQALVLALEVAFEVTVLANQFEIDEQEPLSRLAALTELVVQRIVDSKEGNRLEGNGTVGAMDVISVINHVSDRVRGSIQKRARQF